MFSCSMPNYHYPLFVLFSSTHVVIYIILSKMGKYLVRPTYLRRIGTIESTRSKVVRPTYLRIGTIENTHSKVVAI